MAAFKAHPHLQMAWPNPQMFIVCRLAFSDFFEVPDTKQIFICAQPSGPPKVCIEAPTELKHRAIYFLKREATKIVLLLLSLVS